MNAAFLDTLAGNLTPPLRRGLRSLGLGSPQTWIPLGVVVLLLALSAATLLLGYHHAKEIAQAYRQSVIDQLEAISELKKSELMQWRKERLGDARSLRDNPELAQAVLRLLNNRADTAARATALRWLSLSYTSYGEYDSIFLLDSSGRTVVTTSRQMEAPSAVLYGLLRAGKTERGVRFADFYRDEHDGQIYCAVVYTVFNGAREALGYVAMRIRADAYIYPIIRKWPASSKTGETIIVRREGQLVRYLTNLRKMDSSGLGFTVPVERRDVLAVKAALGQHGTTQGVDFEGVPVVAALTTLPDNSWTLETKIDLAEIESGMSEQARTTGLLVAALAVSMVVGSLVIWKLQRSVVAKNALEAENRLHRSEAQFGNLLETMAQGLVKIDALGAVTYTNSHFLAMLGRGSPEVVGQDISLHAAAPGMRERLCALEADAGAEDSGFEMVWLNSTGGKVFSTVTPVFQPAAAGACAEKWLLILDTTKRKHLESQLLQSQKLEAIGQLAAGIAHEINTPAQYVGNNVKFIKDAFGDLLVV
ncbi:MAG: PAS domain S-box protein, partial [Proteobacteria bacterium]|nr:PAS domain S-box protein [Pseudomonadota bacterium]MBU1594168.1 PAS domain S-box protein [Pseudomonadota bacterium]